MAGVLIAIKGENGMSNGIAPAKIKVVGVML